MSSGLKRLPVGTVLHDIYTIGDIVTEGQGVEGPTYHATGKSAKQYFIRDVGPAAVGDHLPEGSIRYREAVNAIRTFAHPNLCRVVDNFAALERELIVLEAPTGQTLEEVVTAKVPPSRRRVHVLLHQLCMVLAYADSREPPFIFDTLKSSEIYVDSTGHLMLHTYRLSRCFEPAASPLFSADVKDRARNYKLLADLATFVMQKSRPPAETASGRALEPRFKGVIKRLTEFAENPGYTFQEASRSLGSALDTGLLLTGELTDPGRARKSTAKLYSTTTVYTGIDRDGNVMSGEIKSDTLQAAVEKLRGQGVKVDEVHFEGWQDRTRKLLRRLPALPVALLLVLLLGAGGAIYSRWHRAGSSLPLPQHGVVLVAGDDGSLLTVDASTFAVHRVGSLPSPVSDLKVMGGGTLLAVLNPRTRSLSFVRGDNGQAALAGLPRPEGIDKLILSPHRDLLYCIDKEKGNIAILSASDGTLRTSLKTAGGIGDATLSPDGRLLYVSLPRLNTIYEMDAQRGSRRSSFGVGGGPEVLAMGRSQELWVGCQDRTLRVVGTDPHHTLPAPAVNFDAHLVGLVFPTATQGVVLCDDGSVTTLDGYRKGLSLQADGPGPMAFTISPPGNLWISSGRNKALRLMGVATASLDKHIDLPARPVALDLAR